MIVSGQEGSTLLRRRGSKRFQSAQTGLIAVPVAGLDLDPDRADRQREQIDRDNDDWQQNSKVGHVGSGVIPLYIGGSNDRGDYFCFPRLTRLPALPG